MRLKDISWFDRPWTRIKKKGVSNLSDADLLAAVIGRGNKKENAIDLSHRVLSSYNFDKLPDLTLTELEKELGNDIHALRIQAMYEIFRRTNRLKKNGYKTTINTAEDVFRYFVDELEDKKKEYLYALFLDSRNHVIDEELVSMGTLNSSLVHPREVFKYAIKNSANSIVLVHNHPGGEAKASREDLLVTKQIYEAGQLLNIDLFAHVIIAGDDWTTVDIV